MNVLMCSSTAEDYLFQTPYYEEVVNISIQAGVCVFFSGCVAIVFPSKCAMNMLPMMGDSADAIGAPLVYL